MKSVLLLLVFVMNLSVNQVHIFVKYNLPLNTFCTLRCVLNNDALLVCVSMLLSLFDCLFVFVTELVIKHYSFTQYLELGI